MRSRKKLLAIGIIIALSVSLFFSSFYLGLESQHTHHCTNPNCHICLMIKLYESVVKSGFVGISVLGAFIILKVVLRLLDNSEDRVENFITLVSLKVKLSN